MSLVKRVTNRMRREYNERYRYPALVKGEQKIFCIGRNKTGTTSLKVALQDLGFIVGNQRKAERLLPEYKAGNFGAIARYCESAQAFQDFPFSYPETYEHLDQAFPDSKFILTVRDSPEQWYRSVTKYHAKMFGNGAIPTKEDLENAGYVWEGWMWECNRIMYSTAPEESPYQKEALISTYTEYNRAVISYFQQKSESLLVINLAEPSSYQRLTAFLGVDPSFTEFPWENKTDSGHAQVSN